MDTYLHRVTHRCEPDYGRLRTGQDTHIQKMLPERALAADVKDAGLSADFKFLQCHNDSSVPINRYI